MTPADEPRYGEGDASFRAAGGESGIRALVDDFYRLMDELPEAAQIRRMHPRDLTTSRDKLTLFLCGWMNGRRLFQPKYGSISIPGAHARFPIDEGERDAWLDCMRAAVARQRYAPGFERYLLEQLAIPAERVREASVEERARR